MAHSGTIIYMCNVPANGHLRQLTKPLPCKNFDGTDGEIPAGFVWDGSSSGLASPIFPRHDHPIASCRHDWRCGQAKTWQERLWADKEFEKDVGTTSWWITKKLGRAGVAIGSIWNRHKYD